MGRTRSVVLLLAALLLVQIDFGVVAVGMNGASTEPSPADEAGELVLTPFGYRPKSCVHGVPSGATIHNNDDFFVVEHAPSNTYKKVARCGVKTTKLQRPQPLQGGVQSPTIDGEGWQQYVHQNLNNVTSFLGEWNVAPVPKNPYAGQTLFTFTGMQNIDWVPPQPDPTGAFDIIQPVLQFGPSSAGGGPFWSIASWYVTLTDDVVFSDLIQVNANTTIFGNMTKIGDGSWFINTVDTSTGINSSMTITRSLLQTQPWIYVTLEVYGVGSCSQYPPSGSQFAYSKLQVFLNNQQTPTPADWSVGTDGQTPPICKTSIDIVDPQSININF